MRICVFGLGYVGSVVAASLAHDQHLVTGIDVNPEKVADAACGRAPVLEPGLDALFREGIDTRRLRVTLDAQAAVAHSEISIVCVGTPSQRDGSVNVQALTDVCRDIGLALRATREYHVVMVRSTVLPGTVDDLLIPLLERHSGRKAGADFGVVMNPEFLREGTALADHARPALVVIGQLDARSGDVVQPLYEGTEAPLVRTTIRTAELVKYTCNAFHALKVVFANEIDRVCEAHGIDGRELMEIVCRDHRLNISAAYLRPGFAFGGSCLPKDLRALLSRARERDIPAPLLSAIVLSNREQIARAIERVEESGRRAIGVLGLAFKAGTDDVRESPVVSLVETLIGRGYRVSLYDELVDPDQLTGANRSFLRREIPHIAALMRPSIDAVVAEAEVVVVANQAERFRHVPELMRPDQLLIDLAGAVPAAAAAPFVHHAAWFGSMVRS